MRWRWGRAQWDAHRRSYDADALDSLTYAGIILPVLAMAAFVAATAYIPHISHLANFQRPLVPIACIVLGAAASLACKRVGGASRLGAVLTLGDTGLYLQAFTLSAASTDVPVNYGYAVTVTILMVGVWGRTFALTWPIAVVAYGLPATTAVAAGANVAVIMIIVAGAVVGAYTSYHESITRRLQQQNVGLRDALVLSDQISHRSMDIALTQILLKLGHFLHELRNAQISVDLAVRFVTQADPSEQDFAEALQDVLQESQRTHDLIQSAIDNLRRAATSVDAPFEVHQQLHEVVANLRSGPVVRLQPPFPEVWAQGDAAQFQTVVDNLLRNARQAGAQQMSISGTMADGGTSLQIRIDDDGPGIPPQALDTLFDPFVSVDKKDGTGLGLYLCRRSLEMMGGNIEAGSSSLMGGACFAIRLPVVVAPPQPQPQREGAPNAKEETDALC